MTQDKKDAAIRAIAESPVQAGQAWRHYKGNEYVVWRVGVDEATLQPMVIYGDKDGTMWVRSLDSFLAKVTVEVPRFSPSVVSSATEETVVIEPAKEPHDTFEHPMDICRNCDSPRKCHRPWLSLGQAWVSSCTHFEPRAASARPVCARCCVNPATRECVMRRSTWRTVCEECFAKMGSEKYLYVEPDGRFLKDTRKDS